MPFFIVGWPAFEKNNTVLKGSGLSVKYSASPAGFEGLKERKIRTVVNSRIGGVREKMHLTTNGAKERAT
ncbi:plasmid recombination enzyme [Anopheles sinensis]|uniref:Plasmid recombination enzyme n=1 Tax=Anopheles sinensis TaxID=74873 RepID=A0A084VUX7_ANOSI|nr:plasmid recombination enzyme [Anopheles sinensis]